jgi:hypothetical protein
MESDLIGFGGFVKTTYLADKLKRGCLYLLRCDRRLKVVEGADISAHRFFPFISVVALGTLQSDLRGSILMK